MDSTARLVRFIAERERIRLRRLHGATAPWTTDPIMQKYRFCNIHRNDDRVTRWIHKHWLEPIADSPDLWFAAALARLVNRTDTLEALGNPLPWTPARFVKTIEAKQARGETAFTGVYMIHGGPAGVPKARYLSNDVLGAVWKKRELIRPRKHDSLFQFSRRLLAQRDFGGFVTGQVIADAKQFDKHLSQSVDRATWAVSGPGSRRGLNRVLGREVRAPWRKEEEWLANLHMLADDIRSRLYLHDIELDNQDLQNCLCEFDKYERARLKEGSPRTLFRPSEEPLP